MLNEPNMTESILTLRTELFYSANKSYSSIPSMVDNTTVYIPYERRLETYLVPIVFLAIFIIGIIGNGTVVYIYFRNKSMRTIPNTYIISLAIGDLTVIVIALPFVSTIYTVESWPYGEIVCKVSEFIRDVSIGVTVYSLTILSAERYVAIIQPMRFVSHQNKTITFTIIIWSVSILLAIPGAYTSFIWEVSVTESKSIYVCYPFPPKLGHWYPKLIVLSKFLLLYAIPLATITSFYTLIARHLLRTAKNPICINEAHYKQLRGRKKISKIVLGLVVIFAICFFPNQIFMLWYYFHPHANELYNNFWHVWRIIGFILAFVNSCLNPVALCMISGLFRSYFKRYIFWCCDKDMGRRQSLTFGVREYANSNSRKCTPSTYV